MSTDRSSRHRELDDNERAVLDFERGWWLRDGSKDSEIRACFEVSGTTYYRGLASLIELRAAFDYDPLTVLRLRRQRDARRRVRFEGPQISRNS